ncbi:MULTISPECIES: VOC family protein [unclassified Sphingopyxis]|uniref:VOC family protein n=1 Tax=unclassified Sphingopyxis TaxID=2614943 RepID=UPI0007366C88|nr:MULTISPECIES: VOC family protein [unclassified Sphingopyxis]KTE39017.1 glyoxalase [Sphingopyxis sp. HIX]KTE83517.1 glyoxalase [Sphingopyxis sp. HXXIV]
MEGQKNQGPTSGLTPHIAIGGKRGAEAIDFYVKAFGATEQMRMPAQDGVRLMHAHLTVNGASLMMHDDFPEYTGSAMGAPTGVTLHLHVDDTDRWYERAIAAGATSTLEPHDAFWGDRYAQVKDPFGHLWSIGGPIKGETK